MTMRREDVVRIRELGLRHPLQAHRQDPLRSKGILLAGECRDSSKGIGREGEMVVCDIVRISIRSSFRATIAASMWSAASARRSRGVQGTTSVCFGGQPAAILSIWARMAPTAFSCSSFVIDPSSFRAPVRSPERYRWVAS